MPGAGRRGPGSGDDQRERAGLRADSATREPANTWTPDGTVHIGLTDEPVDGPVPDVPEPTEPEIGFPLDVVSAAFDHNVRRDDVVGAHAGLRPLLDDVGGGTADLSRRHAVLTSPEGVVTVVGKLTTYRRMAEHAVDRVVGEHAGSTPTPAGPGRCRSPGRYPDPSSPGWSSPAGWCPATARTRRWCSTSRARSPAGSTSSCWPRSPTAAR